MKLRRQPFCPDSDVARAASRIPHHASRPSAGVALIITLIMIATITFMAITFLALSRREKGQVGTTTEQLTARLAADAGQDRAIAQLLATISATTNIYDFDLLVSTNYINPNGFVGGLANPANVNYDYQSGATHPSLTPPQAMQNLANLLYSPRPPVFITNKLAPPSGSNEFRFYLDLNRDRVYTPNGRQIVTNATGGFYDTNGISIAAADPPPVNTLSNYFTGDPEYIGILQRAERTHGADNPFLSRYAFLVVPSGKTLDANYVHNYARMINPLMPANGGDGFRRNQGVASSEINLASFLVDLNTNAWPGPNQNATVLGAPYQYLPDGPRNTGSAFDDALSFLRYRYAGNYRNLRAAGRGAESGFDRIDVSARSPLMSNLFGLTLDSDATYAAQPGWHGSDNPSHFFTSQDFFDPGKLSVGFSNRLNSVVTNNSSYNRYTYYRMLSQLGTDTGPEPDTKLNLNYININGFKTTNYISWSSNQVTAALGRPGSEVFFFNAADRLVRSYSEEWRNLNYRSYTNLSTYTNTFGTDQIFGASAIPVFVNGRFVYSPSLHRQLQLAANLWDAVNPSYFPGTTNAVPTVFRPIFSRTNLDIYISDFKEVTRYSDIRGLTMRDLTDTNVVASVQPDDLLFGVPLVIGARKDLPNFNEFSSEAVISVTRKVELRRPALNTPVNQTNQMFIVGISNVFGAEFWNSYTKTYPRPVEVVVTNSCSLGLTNDFAYKHGSNLIAFGVTNLTTWPAWKPNVTKPAGPWSFMVPLRTNHIILPDSTYRHSTASFVPITSPLASSFESPQPQLWFPRWGLTITNRVVAIIKEPGANGRIIDYVQLNSMVTHRDFSSDLVESPQDRRYADKGIYGVWATNMPDGIHLGDAPGVDKQVKISMGDVLSEQDWFNNTANLQSGATKYQAIANFLYFLKKEPYYQANDGRKYYGTNTGNGLVATAPFSPTSKRSIPIIYQANDPLVHYMAGDMEYLEKSGLADPWTPPNVVKETLPNLGRLNARYRPWGNYPNSPDDDKLAYQTVVKDPGVTRSGDWQFPTNKLPTVGWMGRIHRGTPWQTVYLKSSRVADSPAMFGAWTNWTGNGLVWRDRFGKYPIADPTMSQPELDRLCLDLFTTTPNENAGRGQLPINQSGLAAWSAVFGGMVALTNTTPDDELAINAAPTGFSAPIIEPAGVYDPTDAKTWTAVAKIVAGINRTRTNRFSDHTFRHLGDLLATPELTEASPFLNLSSTIQKQQGVSDAAYEWLPQQMLSLVRLGEPRFVIYSFGQTLKPAPRGVQVSGTYSGMITNYQITAEVATRAVVRVVGSPDPETVVTNSPKFQLDSDKRYPPRIVVENFNILPPD